MNNRKLLVSSHAPFWHDGSSITLKNYNIMLATLPAVIFGIIQYGAPALGVLALSVSCAMLWELLMNILMKRPVSIGDGSAALIGLLFGMLMPAALHVAGKMMQKVTLPANWDKLVTKYKDIVPKHLRY